MNEIMNKIKTIKAKDVKGGGLFLAAGALFVSGIFVGSIGLFIAGMTVFLTETK